MTEPRVTINDIRLAGHCAAGAKAWLTRNGFDFRRFRNEGATEAELLATGDALAVHVIERKRARDSANG